MFTAKTITQTGRKGLMGRPLPDRERHLVMEEGGAHGLRACPIWARYTTPQEAPGEDGATELRACANIELAQKIARELNDFYANPPKFGDLEAILLDIINQD